MAKTDKLMLLLNLLYHRPYVSVATIQKECEISKRTVYRYVDSLSAARFPVEFDVDVKAYRLTDRGNLVSQFSAEEAAMVLFGLVLLERSLAPRHLGAINRARTKLESRISHQIQEILASGKSLLSSQETPDAIRDFILVSLVNIAALSGLGLRLEHSDKNAEIGTTDITHPKMVFDKEWKIGNQTDRSPYPQIPLRLVRDIQLV